MTGKGHDLTVHTQSHIPLTGPTAPPGGLATCSDWPLINVRKKDANRRLSDKQLCCTAASPRMTQGRERFNLIIRVVSFIKKKKKWTGTHERAASAVYVGRFACQLSVHSLAETRTNIWRRGYAL